MQHRLFIEFTITANLAHAAVMTVQSFTYQGEHAHHWGDVGILFAVIVVLVALRLLVRKQSGQSSPHTAFRWYPRCPIPPPTADRSPIEGPRGTSIVTRASTPR